MTEHIIRDEVLQSIQQTCFEAGKRRHEIFTVRGPGEEIIRCNDCGKMTEEDSGVLSCKHFKLVDRFGFEYNAPVEPDGFCSWAERRGA